MSEAPATKLVRVSGERQRFAAFPAKLVLRTGRFRVLMVTGPRSGTEPTLYLATRNRHGWAFPARAAATGVVDDTSGRPMPLLSDERAAVERWLIAYAEALVSDARAN